MFYNKIIESSQGLFTVLIDPDKYDEPAIRKISALASTCNVDFFLLGGSFVKSNMEATLDYIRRYSNIPVILFPGSPLQFTSKANAILLLSLISGRNADFLIGNHVLIANALKESKMEIIPTGYILISNGHPTSVQYMSNTMPIPLNKPEIAVSTALAGEQLGLKAIYLEAGSGANAPIPPRTIEQVYNNVSIPIIVGGGIKTPSQVKSARDAGAKMIVVGNSLEEDPEALCKLISASK
ncbi:MAG TPA: geranylgeranylglyceryl/heptaprenylglyceryl phosphate synthase [Tenuifilaceae bacterium]|nr:geranylgeranylglyceryl/heptaprenylglyceryl phosphate synthase [Tenuifilaceae bacterium]HPE17561.1 geranylgeranylglyceryl/heptaprenylglyceryl phosphate synthase [Tenuifilaceae bacterium]HPJ45977.1 geranylgeranylglyceryl/heptaprenylglyceryl phosphate synthase [Tenuifilaceae bacterium]HPQ34321.1 geranylgeranylglyceryl/heptaprenylglyceryl phosphate synthase [Tenuifilaceae bacterium]HRX67989.1 geranylgeranylglyceryl/heptaprenylglyceryl phosphate synthase [Tenuifilaceae bacterium]